MNMFAILEHLQEPSSVSEKTKEARNPAETALIAPEFEKSFILGSINPVLCLVLWTFN